MSKQAEYPEHEKLGEVALISQAIGEFVEWLIAQKIEFAVYNKHNKLLPLPMNSGTIEGLLGRYFNIDLMALEAEKRHMIEALRRTHEP